MGKPNLVMLFQKAVFLDRDGVINQNVFFNDTNKWESPRLADQFVIKEGVIKALRDLQKAEFLLFLVSNQPNIAKNKSTMSELNSVHNKFISIISKEKISFVDCYYCFHHPDGIVPEFSFICKCRKPNPFFLLKAAKKYKLSLENSWTVGDRATDIECGIAAGTKTILIKHVDNATKYTNRQFAAGSLYQASQLILSCG